MSDSTQLVNASLWRCPQCGAGDWIVYHKTAEEREGCRSRAYHCYQLSCLCADRFEAGVAEESDFQRVERADHGLSHGNPCENAKCYHCGWEGRIPALGAAVAEGPTCLTCGKEPARVPEERPTFCDRACAVAYAVEVVRLEDWTWCSIHQQWRAEAPLSPCYSSCCDDDPPEE